MEKLGINNQGFSKGTRKYFNEIKLIYNYVMDNPQLIDGNYDTKTIETLFDKVFNPVYEKTIKNKDIFIYEDKRLNQAPSKSWSDLHKLCWFAKVSNDCAHIFGDYVDEIIGKSASRDDSRSMITKSLFSFDKKENHNRDYASLASSFYGLKEEMLCAILNVVRDNPKYGAEYGFSKDEIGRQLFSINFNEGNRTERFAFHFENLEKIDPDVEKKFNLSTNVQFFDSFIANKDQAGKNKMLDNFLNSEGIPERLGKDGIDVNKISFEDKLKTYCKYRSYKFSYNGKPVDDLYFFNSEGDLEKLKENIWGFGDDDTACKDLIGIQRNDKNVNIFGINGYAYTTASLNNPFLTMEIPKNKNIRVVSEMPSDNEKNNKDVYICATKEGDKFGRDLVFTTCIGKGKEVSVRENFNFGEGELDDFAFDATSYRDRDTSIENKWYDVRYGTDKITRFYKESGEPIGNREIVLPNQRVIGIKGNNVFVFDDINSVNGKKVMPNYSSKDDIEARIDVLGNLNNNCKFDGKMVWVNNHKIFVQGCNQDKKASVTKSPIDRAKDSLKEAEKGYEEAKKQNADIDNKYGAHLMKEALDRG